MYSHTHPLNWPIDNDQGQTLTDVTINLLTLEQRRTIDATFVGKPNAHLRALISASTGLSEAEIKRLVTPDHTSIQTKVLELMNATSAKLLSQQNAQNAKPEQPPFNPDEPQLLAPLQGDDGRRKTHYKLRPPTVAMTDLMYTHTDEWDRTLFISVSCSGFSPTELLRMSLPDWNQLQERLIDFLQKPAAYFRPETLKS